MIRTVIFDIGGVLAFDVWEHMFLDIPNGLSSILKLPDNEAKQFGKELWRKFAYISATTFAEIKELEFEYWNQFIKHFNLTHPPEYFSELTEKFIKPVAGVIPLLKKLKSSGVELAICSNNNEFFFHRQMETLDLGAFFTSDKTALSCRVGSSKASPNFEMFKDIMERVNSPKEECLFIDDKECNINRSVEFGLPAILFPSESSFGSNYLENLFTEMNIFKLMFFESTEDTRKDDYLNQRAS